MTTDQHESCGIYVGANTGQLFASIDGGDNWRVIADFLPPIYSVTVSVIE
jgi:hypothetical protein